MNKFLQWFNLLGVCVLAIVSAVQWQFNRHLNLHQLDLENLQLEQTKTIVDRDKTIQGNITDMNEFRDRVARSASALQEAQAAIKADDVKNAQLSSERDQLKSSIDSLNTSLDQWKAAVAARDDSLKQADAQARKLAADRNDAIAQFNELASKYNSAQDQLKRADDQLKTLATDRNDAVAKFNDLANKYNAIVKQLNVTATKP